jgi:TRAP-type C4-dicarboxylate transport system permease small subunit
MLHKKRLKGILSNLPEICLGLLACAITISVVAELVLREVIGMSIFGMTMDLNHLFMVWISMVGAAVAVKRGSHFVFPIIAQRFGTKVGRYLSLLSTLTIVVFSVLMVIVGLRVAWLARNENFTAIPVSLFWEILALPTASALILVYCFMLLKDQITRLKKGDESEEKGGHG